MKLFKKTIFTMLAVAFLNAPEFSYSNDQVSKIIESLPELPPKPTINGVRFVFWHELENLHHSINTRLNPAGENYPYKNLTDLAPDSYAELQANVALYKIILSDYNQLLQSNTIDSYTHDTLPMLTGLRVKMGSLAYRKSLMVNVSHANLLTVMNNKMWDHRYIKQSMFSTSVDRRHKPLDSLGVLSFFSARSHKVIERITGAFLSEVDELTKLGSQIVENLAKPISGSELIYLEREITEYNYKYLVLDGRLTYTVDKLYRAAQIANDIMRDKNIKDKASLELVIAALGRGLSLSLKDIKQYRDTQRFDSISKSDSAIYLSDIQTDITKLLGLNGFYANHTLRLRKSTAYGIYQDALILQYILAVGSIMAKIEHLPEGRGTFSDRVVKELEYRRAQALSHLGQDANKESGALVPHEGQKNMPKSLVKNDFTVPSVRKNQESVEDHLWRVFFEAADLQREYNPSSFMSNSNLLPGKTPEISLECKKLF